MTKTFKGVVIRETPVGEKGKLLHILTENDGVVTVTATGARNISASYLKSVQLFAYSELTVYEKNGHNTLTEAKLIENFYGLRSDVVVLAAASYLSEICGLVSVPDDDGIIRLYLNCLYALSRGMSDTDLVKAVFEYRLCVVMGMAPDFSCCAICGDEGTLYDFEESALFCKECAPVPELAYILTKSAVKALAYLAECPHSKILSFSLSNDDKKVFCDFCEKYFIYAADIKPKSLDFYRELRKDV